MEDHAQPGDEKASCSGQEIRSLGELLDHDKVGRRSFAAPALEGLSIIACYAAGIVTLYYLR